ncbi:MAG: matrixin family metalloprotease [Cytophagaceae bacterium]|nr:matrixin family metalloprotease [Gemmatimonadaceae bacterium]
MSARFGCLVMLLLCGSAVRDAEAECGSGFACNIIPLYGWIRPMPPFQSASWYVTPLPAGVPSDMSAEQVKAAAQTAMNTWKAVCPGPNTNTPSDDNANASSSAPFRIVWESQANIENKAYARNENPLAAAETVVAEHTCYISGCIIYLARDPTGNNVGLTWRDCDSGCHLINAWQIDLPSVLLHELGHSLGLDHNPTTGTVMYAGLELAKKVRDLLPCEREHAQAYYGCSPDIPVLRNLTQNATAQSQRVQIEVSDQDLNAPGTGMYYRLSRRANCLDGFVEIAQIPKVFNPATHNYTYYDNGVTRDTEYEYRLEDGEVLFASAQPWNLPIPSPPSIPTNVTAQQSGAVTGGVAPVQLSWAASTGGVQGYDVYRTSSPSPGCGSWTWLATRTTTSYTDPSAPSNTAAYAVRSRGSQDMSFLSLPRTIVIDGTPPSVVTNLAASLQGTTGIRLNWTAPGDDGAAGTCAAYEMQVCWTGELTSMSPWIAVSPQPAPAAGGTAQQYVYSGRNPCLTYYFRLRARDEFSQWSAFGNWAQLTATSTCGGGGGDDDPPIVQNAPVLRVRNSGSPPRTGSVYVFEWTLPTRSERASISIYDVRGSLIRRFPDIGAGLDSGTTAWDTRSEQGARVPSGIYLATLRWGAGSLVTRLVHLD